MIVIISCHHFPDDERIYHKQIKSLMKQGLSILYYTRSSSDVNVSEKLLYHKNFDTSNDVSIFIKLVYNQLKLRSDIKFVQIHETDLLPIIKKLKKLSPEMFSIYDVHENMEALYRTFSNRIKPIKEMLIKIRKAYENKYLKYVDRVILANPPLKKINMYENNSTTIIENFPQISFLDTLIENKNRGKNSIIYHGHLAPERGIEDLVNAMKHVKPLIPSVYLSLVGTFRTEKFESKINDLIKELDLIDTVFLKNQVPHSEIWNIINSHRIGVIPFRKTPLTEENTPTKLFEMMICGLEIVVTKLPPVQYFIEDSVHWCIPNNVESIATSIVQACNSQDKLSNLQKNRNLIQKKYNWETRQGDYLAIFED